MYISIGEAIGLLIVAFMIYEPYRQRRIKREKQKKWEK